jgi:tetratricopeptide (TPR) repeat protein
MVDSQPESSMANDPTIEDRKVAEIKLLLSEKRFDEAFDRSSALTKEAPGNTEGWWRLTLAADGLKRWEEARNAVKETINLVPRSPIVWGEFGYILEELKQNDEARKAFEMGIKIDPDYGYGHLSLMRIFEKEKEYDGIILHGRALERIEEATPNILDKIGLAFWYKNNFHMSLHYYTKSATLEKQAFRYANLGLIYERPELAQYLDASDAYRRALLIEPDHERALESSSRLSKKLSALALALKQSGTQVLDKTDFHRFYINPFVLLGCDINFDIEDYSTKQIQRRKKALVQEIDLEEGRVGSLGRYTIDKSRALSLCDEILDDTKKKFHWIVFQDKRLCDFLHAGDVALFTYDENYFPAPTLDALDQPAFLNWLSTAFSSQYDLVLSRALDQNNLARVGALLAGRRYVGQQDDDLCFAGARRLIDRRMEPIRRAEKEVSTKPPSLAALSEMLIDPKNPHALAPLLNLLPAAHFRSFQNEAVRLIQSIALNCNNEHSDPDLAREVLQLANAFAFVSVDIKHQVETDEQQVNEIIAKERENEVRLTQGGAPLEITKEGVRKGTEFIAAKELKAIRWGITVTGQRPLLSYDFFLGVLSTQGAEIQIAWSSSKDIDKNNECFSKLINASFSYALPSILEKINADLDKDKTIVIGNCELTHHQVVELTRHQVVIPMAGWFGTKRHEVPWPRVHTEVAKGDLIISDRTNSKVRIAMPIRTTYNAVTIGLIAASRGKHQ